MDFSLTEEQQMLKDSVAKYVQNDYDFTTRRKSAASATAISRDVWETFASLGWLTIPFAEEVGGIGGTIVDVSVIMEEFGRGLVVEPYVPTVLLGGELIACSGAKELQSTWLEKIMTGQSQAAFAYHEPQSRFQLNDVVTRAEKVAQGFCITGKKAVVFNGAEADIIIVSARTSGQQFDESGITLFAIDANDAALVKQALVKQEYRLMDGQKVADIELNGVVVAANSVVGEIDQGYQFMKPIIDRATIAVCAEALGIMEKLYKTTVQYSKTREQFGQPIGKFQALQHRMVDMFIAHELAKSVVLRAVCACHDNAETLQSDIAAMKVMVGKCAELIGREAIQIHGGMGITDELDVGHYVKRLLMIEVMFGNSAHHQQIFSKLNYPQKNV